MMRGSAVTLRGRRNDSEAGTANSEAPSSMRSDRPQEASGRVRVYTDSNATHRFRPWRLPT